MVVGSKTTSRAELERQVQDELYRRIGDDPKVGEIHRHAQRRVADFARRIAAAKGERARNQVRLEALAWMARNSSEALRLEVARRREIDRALGRSR